MNIKKIKASPQVYVEMYLSGQIEECEWIKILQENSKVEKEYSNYIKWRSSV